MSAPFQWFLYRKLKLSDFLRDLHRSIAQSSLERDLPKFFDPPAPSSTPSRRGLRPGGQSLQLGERRNGGFHKPLCVNIPAHLKVKNRSTGFKSAFDKVAFAGRLSFQTGEGDLYVTLKARLAAR
jgi:hypothetical protein